MAKEGKQRRHRSDKEMLAKNTEIRNRSVKKMQASRGVAGRLRTFLTDTIANTRQIIKDVESGDMSFANAHDALTHLHYNVEEIVKGVVTGDYSPSLDRGNQAIAARSLKK